MSITPYRSKGYGLSKPTMFGPLLSLGRKLQTAREAAEETLTQCKRLNAPQHKELIRALQDAHNSLISLQEQINHMRKTEKEMREQR